MVTDMKHTRFYITLGVLGLVTACSLGILVYSGKIFGITSNESLINGAQTGVPRFRYLNGKFFGDNATYTFQTPPEEKIYADDCLGCEQEVGNAVIWAEFGCPKKSEYLFKANSKVGVVEKSPISDSNGSKIGEQRIVVFKDKGNVVGSRLFWIEGQDFWAVQAPTVALTKALRESEEYKSVRKKVVEEFKSYVPIKNANTLIKKPC